MSTPDPSSPYLTPERTDLLKNLLHWSLSPFGNGQCGHPPVATGGLEDGLCVVGSGMFGRGGGWGRQGWGNRVTAVAGTNNGGETAGAGLARTAQESIHRGAMTCGGVLELRPFAFLPCPFCWLSGRNYQRCHFSACSSSRRFTFPGVRLGPLSRTGRALPRPAGRDARCRR